MAKLLPKVVAANRFQAKNLTQDHPFADTQ
jgi:hypothetical protein